MRSLKVLAVFLCVIAMGCLAVAADQNLGIRDVARVTFVAPIRVGTVLLPAGDYLVRHTMESQDHVMLFESVKTKEVMARAKCTLVALSGKASQSHTAYQMNAANERVLQELVFRGDTAKHVF